MSEPIPETLGDLEAQEQPEQEQPQLAYRSILEFFEGMISPMLRERSINPRNGLRWSARWWESHEALLRIDAMWRAFESLRLDPATGISVWLRDHFDAHMAVLTSENGPFGKARDVSERGEDTPHETPPEGMFPVES